MRYSRGGKVFVFFFLLLCVRPAVPAEESPWPEAGDALSVFEPSALPEAALHSPEAAEIMNLWKQNNKKAARRAVKKWMKKEKKSSLPWLMAGVLSYSDGRYKRTLSLCAKALEKAPLFRECFYWRGRAFEALNKPLEAANEYQAALAGGAPFSLAKAALDRILTQLGPSQASTPKAGSVTDQ